MEHVQCFDLPVLILTASTCGLWHIIGDHGEHVGSRVCLYDIGVVSAAIGYCRYVSGWV